MIIECPYCQTRFRLDEARLTDPRAMLKCSRCQHIFPNPSSPRRATPLPPANETEAAAFPRRPETKNLNFAFDEQADSWRDETLHVPEAPEEQFSLGLEAERQWPPVRPERPARPLAPVDLDEEGEEDLGVTDPAEQVPRPAAISVRPILIFLFLVVVPAYAVLALTLYNDPNWAEEVTRSMPFIGGLNRDRLLGRKVVLLNVTGSYERIKDGKAVFIVRGEASNLAAVALSVIEVEVRLLDQNKDVVAQRRTYSGSDLPRRFLRDLSTVEASLIGQLKPSRSFVVQPGERSPFAVVFTDFPSTIAEVSARVAAAQRRS